MRATLNLPYGLSGAKGSLKRALLNRQVQKEFAKATSHPRRLFVIVNVSPGSMDMVIIMDLVLVPQSRDAEREVRLVSPTDVLHSLQQKVQTSLRDGKLTRHITGIEQIQPYALDEESERELSALAREPSEPEPSEALLQAASAFQAAGARKASNRGGAGWAKVRSIVVPAPSASGLSMGVADLKDAAENNVASRVSDGDLQNERPAPDRIFRPRSKWSKVRDSLQKDSKTQLVVESQDQPFVSEPSPTVDGVSIEIGELNVASKKDIERTLLLGKARLGHLASLKEANGTANISAADSAGQSSKSRQSRFAML